MQTEKSPFVDKIVMLENIEINKLVKCSNDRKIIFRNYFIIKNTNYNFQAK